jgi:hypothetical protein
MLAEN